MGAAVLVPVALFACLGGVIAYLAGATGLNDARKLRRDGVRVPALVKLRAPDPSDPTGPTRPLLQFATEDGRVMEVFSPVPSSRRLLLVDGCRITVAYDPADPRQVQVCGRERLWLEYAFLAFGALTVLLGVSALLLVR